MVTFLAGLILLAAPFFLVGLFSDKKRGFIYILFFWLLFQAALAFFTQFLGVFYYWLIFFINLFVLAVLCFYCFKTQKIKNLSFNIKNTDWVLLAIIIISFLSFYQIHYNYTGKITTISDNLGSYHQVKNMRYIYPYFSDEWYAVSLINGSINFHSLPLKNTLANNSFFLDLEMFFHSFLAEIFLILGLNPLLYYTLLSIFFNILIIVLVYIFLRISNISNLAAGICSLSVLYITCSADVPGAWQLIPFTMGIIFSLIGFCFILLDNFKMAFFSFILLCLFYPPLFPFLGISILIFSLYKFPSFRNKIIVCFLGVTALCALTAFIIFSGKALFFDFTKHIFSNVFYTSFTGYFMPQIYFYNIIPWHIILLVILGLPIMFKTKKWLLASFLLGVLFWLIYSFTIYRFLIEYGRVVIFVSVIAVLIAGFGLKKMEEYVLLKIKNNSAELIKYAEVFIITIFLFSAPFYTRLARWNKITFINFPNDTKISPASPANNYLSEDDIKLFNGIKNKRFLSLPWKGTVIGVATGNYPLVSKGGTITIGAQGMLINFLNSDCEGKKEMAKEYNLSYIYLYNFECKGFEKIGESSEKLCLYKVL